MGGGEGHNSTYNTAINQSQGYISHRFGKWYMMLMKLPFCSGYLNMIKSAGYHRNVYKTGPFIFSALHPVEIWINSSRTQQNSFHDIVFATTQFKYQCWEAKTWQTDELLQKHLEATNFKLIIGFHLKQCGNLDTWQKFHILKAIYCLLFKKWIPVI